MAHYLSVTRIPEEKFRRFSRFPFVAATPIDECYNHVYLKQTIYKPNKKSNVNVFDNQISLIKSREVTFDFDKTTKASDKKLSSPPPGGSAHKLDRIKEVTKTGKEENRGNSFIVVKKNLLINSKNNVEKIRKSKEETLEILTENTTRHLEPFDLTQAKDSLQKTRKELDYDEYRFEDRHDIKGATNNSDDKKVNTGCNINAPKVIAEGDMLRNQGPKRNTIRYQVPKPETRNFQAGKETLWLIRNTRFGGDNKITAYRPCTSIDRFRLQNLEAIKETSAVHGLDIEKGEQIWTQVDRLIESSTNRKERMRQQLNQQRDATIQSVAMEKQKIDRKNDLKYAIELRPFFGCGNTSETCMKTILSDNSTLINNEHVKDQDCNKSKFESKFIDGLGSQKFTVHGQKTVIKESEVNFDNQQYSESEPLTYLATRRTCNGEDPVMTTTTLPRIASSRTPLPTGITQPPPRSHSSASMYTAYPPKDLSSSLDYLRVPQRINPLAPPPPRRRINWSWETTDQHYENEKRSLLMQKREHTRYHSAWSKAFYGAPAEKEAYRRHFREVLKQQMSDKNKMEKIEFQEKIKETEQAITYDRDCRMNDAKEYHRKHSYLMQYRDTNKQQMEDRWADTKYGRELENRIDRERLRYNPINWSCSLK